MATLTFDASKINPAFKRNTIYTNTVQLETPIDVNRCLTKVYNKTTDQFGSTKNATHYIIKPDTSSDFNMYCRALTNAIRNEVSYDVHILTKRCELWKEKNNPDPIEKINAFRFIVSVDNITNKVWISVIFTQVTGQDSIDNFDEDGERKRTGDEDLIEVIGSAQEKQLPVRRQRTVVDTEDVEPLKKEEDFIPLRLRKQQPIA